MPSLSRRVFVGVGAAATGSIAAGGMSIAAAARSAPHPKSPSYGPGPGVAKLNSNENPYGPSPTAIREMHEAAKQGTYYVGDSVRVLKSMIAERHAVTPEQIVISAGSSAVLTFIATAAGQKGRIIVPDLFWETTVRLGTRQAGEVLRLPKTDTLGIDLGAMYDAITDEVAMVHVTNPNNPTGMVLDGEALRAFCKKASRKVTVLVDEAYNEITDDPDYYSMVDLVREGYDVIVARTFSKIYGLAGMRVGYTIASPENTAMIKDYALPDFTLNQAGIAAAVASYNDLGFLEMSKAKILEGREMVAEGLKSVGLTARPSATNFMFVDLGGLNADVFMDKMAARSVRVHRIYRDYSNYSRVSMGKLEHVQMYVDALPVVLDEMQREAARV